MIITNIIERAEARELHLKDHRKKTKMEKT